LNCTADGYARQL